MTDTTDPRVGAGIDALPRWQHAFCREVRQLVHAADPQVTETIKRTSRPCFVLEGCIPLRRGHRPRLRGDHHRRPCQQDRPHRSYPVRRSSHRTRADRHVPADHRQRPGGRLARAQATSRPAVTEFGSQPGDRRASRQNVRLTDMTAHTGDRGPNGSATGGAAAGTPSTGRRRPSVPPRPHTGRRRNAAARDAILDATFELLRAQGASGVTIDAIAEAAGVGRQTIYRWWPTKGAVVAEAMVRGARLIVPPRDGSNLEF